MLVGNPATAFVTIINSGATTATSVGIQLKSPVAATLAFQTTNPTTNTVTGTINTPVDIAPGGSQSFVIGITPTAPFFSTEVKFVYGGTNTASVNAILGLNTLLLSGSLFPEPDIVALGATLNNDGIVNIPGATGTGVFAVATVNVGAAGTITAFAHATFGAFNRPPTILICETNPANGACKAAPASSVTRRIATSETPTYGVFVTGNGIVAFSPGVNRVYVKFADPLLGFMGETGGWRDAGATSVAVRTQ